MPANEDTNCCGEFPMDHNPWLDSLFASIDDMDAQRFAAHLAPDALFQFGNAPAVHGTAEIVAAVGGFFGAIAGVGHRLLGHWTCGDTTICHGMVTYRRLDGGVVTVPFANVMTMDGAKAREYRIFADVSPLFAAS